MDDKSFNAAKQGNLCGGCGVAWPECQCAEGARTESVESLLGNRLIFPGENNRHLCIFLYHCYQRCTFASDSDDYSAGCLPPWEGWYAAWLKPSNSDLTHQPCCDGTVLPCTVQYCNGTSADGFIDSSGSLMVKLPGPRPPGGLDFDSDRHILVQRVGVTQCMTLNDIDRHSRGFVHNLSKASHIVRQEGNERVRIAKLPRSATEPRETTVVATTRVKTYAPHLYEEVRWRTRRRFTKKAGATVQLFMHRLFQRAMLADESARYALRRKWIDARAGPNTQLGILNGVVQRLASVPDAMTESIDSRAEEFHGTGDESRDRKRLRQ